MTFERFIAQRFRLDTRGGKAAAIVGVALLIGYDFYSPRAIIFDFLFAGLLVREYYRTRRAD